MTVIAVALGISTAALTDAYATDYGYEAGISRRKAISEDDSIAFENACRLLKDQKFVIEANRVIFDRGQNVMVTPTTNFLMLNNNRAVVQIAPRSTGGPNGVGGITMDGTPSAINYRTDKRGNFYMEYNVNGPNIAASVNITLPYGSTSPNVRISAMFNSSDITVFGDLLSPDQSQVFQGLTF